MNYLRTLVLCFDRHSCYLGQFQFYATWNEFKSWQINWTDSERCASPIVDIWGCVHVECTHSRKLANRPESTQMKYANRYLSHMSPFPFRWWCEETEFSTINTMIDARRWPLRNSKWRRHIWLNFLSVRVFVVAFLFLISCEIRNEIFLKAATETPKGIYHIRIADRNEEIEKRYFLRYSAIKIYRHAE